MANGTIGVSQIDVLTTSGTGTVSIVPPATNTNRTLTLPDETGTVVSTASTPTFTGAVTAPAFIPNGSTVPSNGAYLITTNMLGLSTNTTERVRIDSSGNLMIGTTTSNSNRLSISGSAGGNGDLGFNSDASFSYIQSYNSKALILNNAGNEVRVCGTTDNGAYNLQCLGTGVWGAGAYTNGSDSRIKDDIAPIESGLDVVEKLNPVTFKYKEDWSKDQSTQTGFIAQELLVALEGKNYVEGVVQQGGSEGYYSVAYQNIIPILTKAIQELKSELDDTKARLAALENK